MNFKLVPMLIGVIAATAIGVTPLAAFAQTPAPSQPTQPARPRITLSTDQQAQFEKLQAATLSQIEAVLNSKQKDQYATARKEGQGLIQALGAIEEVTEPQKTKIVAILQKFNSDIGNILTDEQKAQIRQSQPQPNR